MSPATTGSLEVLTRQRSLPVPSSRASREPLSVANTTSPAMASVCALPFASQRSRPVARSSSRTASPLPTAMAEPYTAMGPMGPTRSKRQRAWPLARSTMASFDSVVFW